MLHELPDPMLAGEEAESFCIVPSCFSNRAKPKVLVLLIPQKSNSHLIS